ncbi:hypothetical protein [Dyella sedimenti]|uniref:hypothetical protein n=1 Tax=Dyella sedimenti TaxID=2919947 RepID=UPI001FA9A5FE|nr:hypothetical protein [Dyella sedimenti]
MKPQILLAVTSIAALLALPVHATGLDPALTGVDFLVGHWTSDDGKVADTGGTSRGSSEITVEVNGKVLLRRDHTDLFNRSGKPAGGFDQLMMIYPENGVLHADYSDGKHIIHYTNATIVPGHSVVFTSSPQAGAPTFRLSYELTSPAALTVSFAVAAPGRSDFHPVASGTLKKG